jgi:hypothetical protein
MLRVAIPVLALLVVAGCSVHGDRAPASAVQRGCEYLWSQQAQDGGWRSATYGLLKSGQSLTPFVLNTLVQIPEGTCKAPAGGVDRALAFIKRNTNSEGAVGKMDPLLHDYPNYASALSVQAIRRAARTNWRREVAPIVAWLRTQQLTESHGWKRDDAAYGAWGMGGEPRVAPNAGHVDMSMTRYVLQALATAEVPSTDPAPTRARVFVERCQNPDGGFFFSTVVVDANKAGQDEGARYRSYGTATADGILALLALGDKPSSDHVQSAARWLTAHDIPNGAPGFKGEAYRRWTPGLRFYYAAASVEAFKGLSLKPSRQLISSLESSQRSDGSWRNAENLVKEDDPLIATTFAVSVLNQ